MNLELLLSFLILINPFAQFLYLKGLMDRLSSKDFYVAFFKGNAIAFVIFAVFGLFGDAIFSKVLQIEFESFRVFGGIIVFSYAYIFIMKSSKSLVKVRESLDDTAAEIAMPFIVGAGTISLSIMIAYKNPPVISVLYIALVLLANFGVVALLKAIKDKLIKGKIQLTMDRYSNIFARINGYLLGAIGVDMIAKGVKFLYLSKEVTLQ